MDHIVIVTGANALIVTAWHATRDGRRALLTAASHYCRRQYRNGLGALVDKARNLFA